MTRNSTTRVAGMLAAVTICSLIVPAAAYDVAGHHYVISTILAGSIASQSPTGAPPRAVDPYQRLESFCVELPDLVPELDAVTQRFHVLFSKSDWQWGAFGRCATPISRHMVATQWYIHGLTALNTDSVRKAALALIANRHSAAAATTNAQDRVNLICEAGFGLHLLGDTFAHSQLSKPATLYATGNGHALDKHVPDQILSRSLKPVPPESEHWTDWVAVAAKALGQPNDAPQLAVLIQPILSRPDQQGQDYGETSLVVSLRKSLWKDWEPYDPPLERWRQDSRITGIIKSSVSCDGLLSQGVTGTGIAVVDGQRPNCDSVWTEYLHIAQQVFAEYHADPVRDGKLQNCDATGDRLSNGVDSQ